MKKVLILGGAGFIGLELARFLGEKRKYNITIADICSTDKEDSRFSEIVNNNSIAVIKGDFTDPQMFSQLGKHYDYVYMLASVVGVNRCIQEPHEVIRINTALIQNTLQWVINNNVGKVLFSSSSECYSASTDIFNYSVPTSEEVPLTISEISHPRFTYAVTKILGESAFLNYGKKYDFPITIIRYQNIFGPRMGFKHVIPHLVERFYNKEDPYRIFGPNQTRAFCYVDNAVEGTVLAMENDKSDQEVFHMGTAEEITIEKLVKFVGEFFEYKGKYISSPTYPGSVSRRCPDISKAKKFLGYKPKISWEEGLIKTILWYKDFFESGSPILSGGFEPPESLTNNL